MEDARIIELYWARDEQAIRETDRAYGGKLHRLADRIVQCREDAQECVSDTYLKAWDTIPPTRPQYLFAYLAKICRNFALGRLDWNNAAKRKADVISLTAELELCVPDDRTGSRPEAEELGTVLNRFLADQSKESRMIFLRRYWHGDAIADIAARYGISESKVKTRLHRTRSKLYEYLKKEGIDV